MAFNRTSINRGSPPFFDPLDLGVRNFHTYCDGEMVLTVTGGFNISAGHVDDRHLLDELVPGGR